MPAVDERCSRRNARLVSSETAPTGEDAVPCGAEVGRRDRKDDMDILGIVGAVFQLIGDILGFVTALLNAIL
jgi:hypothetical protein